MKNKHSSDPLRVLAERLERRRRLLGLSVQDLAQPSGLDLRQIEAALAGTEAADIAVILKLAGALDIDSRELFEGIRWVPSPGGGEYRVEDPEGG